MGIRDALKRLVHRPKADRPRQPGKAQAVGQEYAVIGLGRFGRTLALRLSALGMTVMGIDIDPKKATRIADSLSASLVFDASLEDGLREADIESFDTVVVALGGDHFEAAALATISLARIGIRRIICLANSKRQEEILLAIGAHRVLNPIEESGTRLADELADPGIGETWNIEGSTQVALLPVPGPMVGMTMESCREKGVHVLLLQRGEKSYLHPGDLAFEPHDRILVAGDASSIQALRKLA
ncbi:MAG: TrkA family potassium uptake protein [Anaerolineales bacterium]|nr:TrkA family potassium uptake protein [Anaerolineales bacterium]